MKKTVCLIMCIFLVITLFSSCSTGNTKGTIYILGPTPDHGWTAQAGTYAKEKAEEITKKGKYKGVYLSADNGSVQNTQVEDIIKNGDAAGVVFFALDNSAKDGQEALIEADIPFISFDRIIEGPDEYAILNASGDNWQCGAAIAYWLQQKGMVPGDTLVTLIGDTGTVSSRRQDGFEAFLKGETEYYDGHTRTSYKTTEIWTQEQIDELCSDYEVICNWSADKSFAYLKRKLSVIVKTAKAKTGRLFMFSQDDEMTFGMLNLLERNEIDEKTKKDLENLDVYISAIGGMQELYNVMADKSRQSDIASRYFDDMMSVYFSPKMMINVIGYMEDYLSGDWNYEKGAEKYEVVWIVDKKNVSQYEGFTGHEQ